MYFVIMKDHPNAKLVGATKIKIIKIKNIQDLQLIRFNFDDIS